MSVTVHLEAKTAYFAVLLHEAGAEVAATSFNSLSTQDDVRAALAVSVRAVRQNVTEYEIEGGWRIYVMARDRLLNSGAGDGHPVEIMNFTFALHALGLRHLASHATDFECGAQPLPQEIDQRVARIKLATLGVEPDALAIDHGRAGGSELHILMACNRLAIARERRKPPPLSRLAAMNGWKRVCRVTIGRLPHIPEKNSIISLLAASGVS